MGQQKHFEQHRCRTGFRGNLCIFPRNTDGRCGCFPADRYSILESGYSCPHSASRKHLAAKIYPESATDLPAQNLALSQRIFCTTPKTIRGRLLVYLSNQAAKAGSNHFKIPFDRQGLADYLNVDRSALSKELGKMRDEGILTTRKNAFTLYGLSHEPLLYVSFPKAFH